MAIAKYNLKSKHLHYICICWRGTPRRFVKDLPRHQISSDL